MIGRLCFVAAVLASAFKSKIRLEAENATLRHQLVVLRRKLKDRCLGKRPLGHESSYCREDNERWDDHSAFMRILGAMETRARADRTKISRRTVEAAVPSYQEWV
jgi:hypothetical protein